MQTKPLHLTDSQSVSLQFSETEPQSYSLHILGYEKAWTDE